MAEAAAPLILEGAATRVQRMWRNRSQRMSWQTLLKEIPRLREAYLDENARQAGAASNPLYSDRMIAAREKLRKDPAIIAAMDRAWDSLVPHGRTTMPRKTYFTMARKLYLAAIVQDAEESGEVDVRLVEPREAARSIDDDWQADAGPDQSSLGRDDFYRTIFQLADLQTNGIGADEYAGWIEKTFRRVRVTVGEKRAAAAAAAFMGKSGWGGGKAAAAKAAAAKRAPKSPKASPRKSVAPAASRGAASGAEAAGSGTLPPPAPPAPPARPRRRRLLLPTRPRPRPRSPITRRPSSPRRCGTGSRISSCSTTSRLWRATRRSARACACARGSGRRTSSPRRSASAPPSTTSSPSRGCASSASPRSVGARRPRRPRRRRGQPRGAAGGGDEGGGTHYVADAVASPKRRRPRPPPRRRHGAPSGWPTARRGRRPPALHRRRLRRQRMAPRPRRSPPPLPVPRRRPPTRSHRRPAARRRRRPAPAGPPSAPVPPAPPVHTLSRTSPPTGKRWGRPTRARTRRRRPPRRPTSTRRAAARCLAWSGAAPRRCCGRPWSGSACGTPTRPALTTASMRARTTRSASRAARRSGTRPKTTRPPARGGTRRRVAASTQSVSSAGGSAVAPPSPSVWAGRRRATAGATASYTSDRTRRPACLARPARCYRPRSLRRSRHRPRRCRRRPPGCVSRRRRPAEGGLRLHPRPPLPPGAVPAWTAHAATAAALTMSLAGRARTARRSTKTSRRARPTRRRARPPRRSRRAPCRRRGCRACAGGGEEEAGGGHRAVGGGVVFLPSGARRYSDYMGSPARSPPVRADRGPYGEGEGALSPGRRRRRRRRQWRR